MTSRKCVCRALLLRSAALVVLTGLALMVASPGVGTASTQFERDPRPVVLLFHPGGFLLDANMSEAAAAARAHGMAPVNVDYPLGDPMAAWRFARAAADKLGNARVVAYGESAGAVLAARLAELDYVERAVSNSAPSDLLRWQTAKFWATWFREASVHNLRWLSPALHGSKRPILDLAANDDNVVPIAMNVAWAKRLPLVRFHRILGGHLGKGPLNESWQPVDPSYYRRTLNLSFGWLAQDFSLASAPVSGVPDESPFTSQQGFRRGG